MADDDKRDPPIEEQPFLSGVRIVDIGDYRVARGKTRRHYSGCQHKQLVYDNAERRIWCKDCERDVEPFDAFVTVAVACHDALEKIKAREARVAEAEAFRARSLAVKALDDVWRGRNHVPVCPHCRAGLMPEDFMHGVGRMGREFAKATNAKCRQEKRP